MNTVVRISDPENGREFIAVLSECKLHKQDIVLH